MSCHTSVNRFTIDAIQRFAKEHGLSGPDAYVASGEGGLRLGRGVRVVEVHVSTDPKQITALRT